MSEFRRASEERVNAFEVDERYLFKHYFEGDDVFDRLREYYEHSQYRFAVPPAAFPEVRSFLAEHGYALVLPEDPDAYVVVVRAYTDHPENVFKRSVAQRSRPDWNFFLMTDRDAVDAMVEAGATRLAETDLANPFATDG